MKSTAFMVMVKKGYLAHKVFCDVASQGKARHGVARWWQVPW